MRLPSFINRLSLNIKLNLLLVIVFMILALTLSTVTRRSIEALVLGFGQAQLQEEAALLQQHFADTEDGIIQSTRLLAAASGLVTAIQTEDVNETRTALLLQAESLD